MTQVLRAVLVLIVMMAAAGSAARQAGQTTQQPAPAQPTPQPTEPTPPPPTTQTPATPDPLVPPVTPAPVALGPACPVPVAPAVAPSRAFTGQTGMLLHQVIPARVPEFDLFLDYVRDALAKATNDTVRKQASGWSFFRVPEAGPNGDVLYVFLLSPAVPCVDYALGPIVTSAYPDPAQQQEIWNLYRNSVRNGGTLMNLIPLALKAPAPIRTAPTTPPTTPGQTPSTQKPGTDPTPSAPGQSPQVPLDANPVRPPAGAK